jgi:hypothetical protein
MKKIGLIILIAIVALGAMGAGYAAWTQTLNITGTATVATFNVSMIHSGVEQFEDSNVTTPLDADNTTFKVTINDTVDKETYNASGNAGLIATITNAVPGIYKIKNVQIYNQSNIPVKFTITAVEVNGTVALITNEDASGWVDVGPLSTQSGTALAVGAKTTAGDIVITIPNEATQGSNYSFIIPVTVTQS